MRIHDCVPIGTILNHVHRYTLMWNSNTYDAFTTSYPHNTFTIPLRPTTHTLKA
jgi:hypothetical protein